MGCTLTEGGHAVSRTRNLQNYKLLILRQKIKLHEIGKKAKIADLQSQATKLRILKGRHTFKIKGAVIGVYIEGCLDNYLF